MAVVKCMPLARAVENAYKRFDKAVAKALRKYKGKSLLAFDYGGLPVEGIPYKITTTHAVINGRTLPLKRIAGLAGTANAGKMKAQALRTRTTR